MPDTHFDPEAFKAAQRREWGETALSRRQHRGGWEQSTRHVNERLIALAGIREGQRVLDVATGLGEPALTAAAAVGPAGRVVATDLSPEMLAVAKQIALERGLNNVEFHEMDAEAPDLPEESFDAILCRFGLMYLPDLPGALAKLRLLLLPGGHFAAVVWGPAEKVPFSRIAIEAARRALGTAAPAPGKPGPFNLGDIQPLTNVFIQAGFVEISVEPLAITVEYPSAEVYFDERLATSVPFRKAVAGASAEQQEEIRRIAEAELEPFRAAEGGFRIPNEALCVVGRRPR